jgi:hypothetical protein
MKKHFAILLVGLLVSTSTVAETITTLGDHSCSTWIRNREAKGSGEIADLAWLNGFLTGFSFGLNKNILADTDSETASLWMDDYCKSHHLEDISLPGSLLANELMKRKGIQ